MFSIGYNIRQPNDILQLIELADLARRIREPDPKFASFIEQLRTVLSLDPKKYRELKTRLPYVVAAKFNPPYRRIDHFISSTSMIVDFDHLRSKDIDPETLRNKINNDPRVLLSFISPSGDGFKAIFRFSPAITDPAKFSTFYKIFAYQLAKQHNVEQVIDITTSDVSRACFVSHDPRAYFNPNAEAALVSSVVDFDNQLSLSELLHQVSVKKNTETVVDTKPTEIRTLTAQDLPTDILQQIKERLNPNLVNRKEKKIYVPGELDALLDQLSTLFVNNRLRIESVKNIHYGKQLKVAAGNLWGEINIFYGKKGFSVVKSTKSGSDERITEAAALIVENYLSNEQEEAKT